MLGVHDFSNIKVKNFGFFLNLMFENIEGQALSSDPVVLFSRFYGN